MSTFPILCGSAAAYPSRVGQAVHNAAYRHLGLSYTYVAFGVQAPPEAVANAMRTLGIRGLAITMPYKESIIPFLDRIDPIANEIGAVNTILNDDGQLVGHNADWLGATRALESHSAALKGCRAYIAGAGGAARAVAFGLKQREANVTVFNRSPERGERLATELGIQWGGSLEQLGPECELLVHATPAGHFKHPDLCVVPSQVFSSQPLVMDVVAEPIETPLLREASQVGCHTIPGYHMRLHQAAAQFELYTGREPPLDVMKSELLQAMDLR